MSDAGYTKVRFAGSVIEDHWKWCSDNLVSGTWHVKYGFLSSSGYSFYFKDEADAVAFRLVHGGDPDGA